MRSLRRHTIHRMLVQIVLLVLGIAASWAWTPQNSRRLQGAPTPDSVSVAGQSQTLLPDGRVLVIGGEGPEGPRATADIIDPQSGQTVRVSADLTHARAWHSATVLPNGKVLIYGGTDRSHNLIEEGELFDPLTQEFQTLPPTTLTPRAGHTATVLTDGRVLFAGGRNRQGDVLSTLDVWDARTGNATSLDVESLLPRTQHTATLLPDGTTLLSGGIDADGVALTYGEVVDPQSHGVWIQGVPIPPSNQLRLEESRPEHGAIDVPLDAVIALRFSGPLQVQRLTDRTVVLSSSQGEIAATVVPAESGRLVFMTPAVPLRPGTVYTLMLTGVVDTQGRSLPDALVVFATEGQNEGQGSKGAGGSDADGTVDTTSRQLPPLQATPGVTALAGQVLQLNGRPLADVTLSVDSRSTRSDSTGRFLLTSIPAGHRVLVVEGKTANRGDVTYGRYPVGVTVLPNKTKVLEYTIWMTPLDTVHAVTIPSPTTAPDTVIRTPRLPGLELHLPAQTVIMDAEGHVVRQISITPIPLDKPPFPLPAGVVVPLYFTIQPGGAYLRVGASGGGPRGATLIYPNAFHQRPGTRFDFWNYDAEAKGWYIYGNGRVSADGQQVVPDRGVYLYEFTGAMVGGDEGAPGIGGSVGDPGYGGEPVQLATGLFVHEQTDLMLPDVIPLRLARTYRSNDSRSRSFGIGATHTYEMFMVGDTNPFTYQELILPDGARIRFDRISPGTGYLDALYLHSSSRTLWYGATLRYGANFPGASWTLMTKDGTQYFFPNGALATDTPGQALLGIRDRYGNTVSIIRGYQSRIDQITSPNGRFINFQYDTTQFPPLRIKVATDNLQRQVKYDYDAAGRLWKVTDANNGVTIYTYDDQNRMQTIQDPRGIVYMTNDYDSAGRVKTQTFIDTGVYTFDWTAAPNAGNTRPRFFTGSMSPPSAANGGAAAVMAYRNCADCQEGYTPVIAQVDITDPNGVVRRVTYGPTGYLTGDTRALGLPEQQTTTYEYFPDNLVKSMTDPLGRKTTYEYDANGHVTRTTRLATTPNPVITSMTYEPTYGQVQLITDPLQHQTRYDYFPNGALQTVTDALNHQTNFTYNTSGQVLTVQDALHHISQFDYFAGDLVSITDPLGRSVMQYFDGGGRLLSVRNALGQTTQYQYDNMNQRTRVTDPLGGVTSFTYDPDGNLATVTDAVQNQSSTPAKTIYTYDDMDRLKTRQDPLGNIETYDLYDFNGNLTQFTDRNRKITTYQYDGMNRRTFVGFGTMPGPTYESTTSYAYDNVDRLTQASDSITGLITRSYDDQTRTMVETTPQGSLTYVFDDAARRKTMTVAGQPVVTYAFDDADRLKQLTQGPSTVLLGYDDANRRTSVTLANNIVMSYAYDDASQLKGITYQLGTTTLGNLTYDYDDAERRVRIGGSYARTGSPAAVATTQYNANNQLTQWDTAMLTYDLNGNVTNDGTNTYTWNARNLLASISGGNTASFQYDPFGRRSTATLASTTTNYLYDNANDVQQLSGATPMANLLSFGIDEVFARTDASGAVHFLTDGLGSTLGVTDSAGAFQATYTYDPFGLSTRVGLSTNPYQYTGRENDGNGLYFYRARYYKPQIDRFIGEDPLEFSAGNLNLYGYVHDSPTNLTDPSGLAIWVCSRRTSFGVGNHAYFWNDKNGTCCGTFSTTSCKEAGPKKDACRQVPDSAGLEEEVLRCCRGDFSNSWWVWRPGYNDCQNNVNDCLKQLRLQNPGIPGGRFHCPDCDNGKK
jgi:RHS repeat-associated protein